MATYLPVLTYLAGLSNFDRKWGLFIYRTTYDDQELWERYLAYVKTAIMHAIKPQSEPDLPSSWNPFTYEFPRRAKLQSRFELLTKEDKKNLNGKSISEAREEFRHWVATVPSEEKKGISRPRYNYFLYVDRDVLDRFQIVETARGDREPDYVLEDVIAIIVEADWEKDTLSDDDDDDVGKEWQFIQVHSIPRLYDSVIHDEDGWFRYFTRPPYIYGMTI
ncbi:uncharacterized protein F4817DRAFT_314632 [Daldinia loculata]|uniref:uncharacterized protein n=1 Tax=Daldinia loculata TaxID=103429 RepID=UPI0020C249A2|nr:uncharacterized protein F4817DRAFT_314632 [Daldinia loculata]KAI1648673.1 hypothetical protein F4817DRAFT_314632 [Daldinia loculata]